MYEGPKSVSATIFRSEGATYLSLITWLWTRIYMQAPSAEFVNGSYLAMPCSAVRLEMGCPCMPMKWSVVSWLGADMQGPAKELP